MQDLKNKLEVAKNYLYSQVAVFPKILITLGSGLNGLLDEVEVEKEILFRDIPGCNTTHVEGHRGKLIIGKFNGVKIAIMQGRTHYYELCNMQEVVFPFRVFAYSGAEKIILTNAAGSLNKQNKPGHLVLIHDHLNLMGDSPLLGKNHDFLGTRFPEMNGLYENELTNKFRKVAKKKKIKLNEGVYAGLHGPSFETPSEIKMYKILGADLVGMSTVPEAIALHHMGCQVSAFSYVSNMAAGLQKENPSHEEVLDNSKKVYPIFQKLLKETLPLI
jgi:purine-nucleoside phosphorylase